MASPVRRALYENFTFLYPFGNTPAKNLLSCLGEVSKRKLKVLLLGCGDLRNVFHTLKEEPALGVSEFHINDASTTILARNILMCYIVTCGKFDFSKGKDLQFLWEVWYDMEWTEHTARNFLKSILKLLQGAKVTGVYVTKEDIEKIRRVFQKWIVSIFAVDRKEMCEERRQFMIRRSSTRYLALNRDKVGSDPFTFQEAVNSAVTQLVSEQMRYVQDGNKKELMKEKLSPEYRRYYETGNTSRGSGTNDQFVCINPTFLDPATGAWWVHDVTSPFHSHAPPDVSTRNPTKTATELCQEQLKDLVLTFQTRVNDGKVVLNVHLGDAVELCLYRLNGKLFDVIDCSNLADHVGLANLVPFAAARLATNGRLVTETMTWSRVCKTIEEYLNVCLCAPVSMYPTLFGVRLLNNVALACGPPSGDPSLRLVVPAASLVWAPAPVMSHPPPAVNFPSCGISQWISSMLKRCASLEFSESKCPELHLYTPYTLALALRGMEQRIHMPSSSLLKYLLESTTAIPEQFRLTWTAAATWLAGGDVVKYSALVSTSRSLFTGETWGTPGLRLLLFRNALEAVTSMLLKDVSSLGSNVAVIDNVECVFQPDDPEKATVSFVAHKDLDLGHYEAALVVAESPLLLLPFTEVFTTDRFKTENFPLTNLEVFVRDATRETANLKNEMTVMASLENPSFYEISLKINCKGNPSGLKLKFDLQRPCEAAQHAVVSLQSPRGVPPFHLSFGWPVLADGSSAVLHKSDRKIVLRFPKALYEPWPSDFTSVKTAKKLVDPDTLAPFSDVSQIGGHLLGQFTCEQLKQQRLNDYPSWEGSPLLQLKATVKILFVRTVREGFRWFGVRKTATSQIVFFILAHLPVKRTADGTPFLLVTVVDHRLAEKLIDEGLLDRTEGVRQFTEVFRNDGKMEEGAIYLLCDEAEQHLFRFMLRSNSLKMQPSKWQRENVPLGPKSPWLATFVTPLYAEQPGDFSSLVDILDSTKGKELCASCQKIDANLKRCGKCKSVFYCSAACQKAHWRVHKIKCSA